MQSSQVTKIDATPPAAIFQQPTIVGGLNAGLPFAIIQNTVGLVPATQNFGQSGLGQIASNTNTAGDSVTQTANLGQVNQTANLGQVTHTANLGQVTQGVTLRPSSDLTDSSSIAQLPHVSSGSSIGEGSGVVIKEDSSSPILHPSGVSDNGILPCLSPSNLSVCSATTCQDSPSTLEPTSPLSQNTSFSPVSSPAMLPQTNDDVVLAVNVTSAVALQTLSLGVTSQVPHVGDASPDFVDKLLAGGSAGVGAGDKTSHQGSPLKPVNMTDRDWLSKLPSYTEAVQAKQDFFSGPSPSNQPQDVLRPTPEATFTIPDRTSDYSEQQPAEQPFQSYLSNQSTFHNSHHSNAPSTSRDPYPGTSGGSSNHSKQNDLLSVITKLRQSHVEDLTLAKTPKGTGGGYGLGGEEGMDMLSSILNDDCSDEK